MARISVIIPAYNEENYIEGTLKSIKAQTVDSEIIVVSNGSTDRTADVSRKHADVIETDKRGAGVARNIGAGASSGDILVFLDADTRLHDMDALEKILLKMKGRHSIGTMKLVTDERTLFFRSLVFFKNVISFFGVSNGVIITRRDVFNRVGGFNENLKYGEDGNFIRKCRLHGLFKVVPARANTSMRRYKKWRIIKAVWFWMEHYILFRNVDYEPVR